MIANSGTRYGELYAPADEVLQSQRTVDAAASNLASGGGAGEDAFGRSRERFEQIVGWLDAQEAVGLEQGELESRLETEGRELVRCLFQDHLDLRAGREQRVDRVTDAAGATGQVRERTGLALGKRQVEELAVRAAVDFDAFYAERVSAANEQEHGEEDVLVLSADGKGIVMRSEALREATAKAAQRASPKLKTRLSKGEKANRKRIAEVGAVYEVTPAPRTPEDVLAPTKEKVLPSPKAKHKWLTASVVEDAATVVADIFDEAQRRDPDQQRTWIALVDGNNHQIDRIKAEARKRKLKVTIVVDVVHVLEYLWGAAWCFFTERRPRRRAEGAREGARDPRGQGRDRRRRDPPQSHPARTPRREARQGRRAADYLLNKRPYLDYPTALANGWPIATGVIEGACRHLIKDRTDITGARWGLDGAEAILKLRALRSNDDFDSYWDYHLARERHRNHDLRYANGVIPREA
ncbi:MAG: ISKra4 family transposase [Solirubrobacteraceae bacterium]